MTGEQKLTALLDRWEDEAKAAAHDAIGEYLASVKEQLGAACIEFLECDNSVLSDDEMHDLGYLIEDRTSSEPVEAPAGAAVLDKEDIERLRNALKSAERTYNTLADLRSLLDKVQDVECALEKLEPPRG